MRTQNIQNIYKVPVLCSLTDFTDESDPVSARPGVQAVVWDGPHGALSAAAAAHRATVTAQSLRQVHRLQESSVLIAHVHNGRYVRYRE